MNNQSPNSVQKHHSFFWNTNLSNKRMKQISDWIGSLAKEEQDMLYELLTDAREDTEFDMSDHDKD